MGDTFRTVRVRAGMYVTPDAQFRIVRRRNALGTRRRWYVQAWNAELGYYADLIGFGTLAKARKYAARRTETFF